MSAAHTWYRDVCIPTDWSRRGVCQCGTSKGLTHICIYGGNPTVRMTPIQAVSSEPTTRKAIDRSGLPDDMAWASKLRCHPTEQSVCPHGAKHCYICAWSLQPKQDIRSVEYQSLGKATTARVSSDRSRANRMVVCRSNGRLTTAWSADRSVCIHGVYLHDTCVTCRDEY